jgi:hypothetical protein
MVIGRDLTVLKLRILPVLQFYFSGGLFVGLENIYLDRGFESLTHFSHFKKFWQITW